MKGLTEGRIVHYVTTGTAQHRPAIIVNAWKHISAPCEGYVNLMVFTDGANDVDEFVGELRESVEHGIVWVTSVCHNTDGVPGTWHWIEPA